VVGGRQKRGAKDISKRAINPNWYRQEAEALASISMDILQKSRMGDGEVIQHTCV
jgi:hypothetical protein